MRKSKRLTTFQIILLGFAGVILLGAVLLMLPFSSKSGEFTPFMDALFTSTSAVCVTGLVVVDTATHWSIFGQAVILILIQTGGLGVITVASSVAMLAGKKIGLKHRSTIQEAVAAPQVGGIMKLTKFILKIVFTVELIGALALLPAFCADFGWRGIWLAVFHSISAFCNAGFDILGREGAEYVSLTGYAANPLVNIVIMLLIILGGIGFLVWEDVFKNKFKISKYRMQSKVVLLVTAVLILVPTVYLFFVEYRDGTFGERLLSSLFQAVTPRTAGFNTQDLTSLQGASRALMICLMLIGGSPGSTAGGMKTSTVAVLFSSMVSVFRKKENAQLMGRRVSDETVKSAASILLLYISLFLLGGAAISLIEGIDFGLCLFETASALGTVGLSLGITGQLGIASQLILIALMFIGRIGGLTLIYATFGSAQKNVSKLPIEKITVG